MGSGSAGTRFGQCRKSDAGATWRRYAGPAFSLIDTGTVRKTLKKWLHGRFNGVARFLFYLIDMPRSLRCVRLALHPARRFFPHLLGVDEAPAIPAKLRRPMRRARSEGMMLDRSAWLRWPPIAVPIGLTFVAPTVAHRAVVARHQST